MCGWDWSLWMASKPSCEAMLCIINNIYEGRPISNAHGEISRKRGHVFKQTKVGSKLQYCSYKLTYLFFDIVALSFNTFLANVKQVYACRQWRIQEFFVWTTTSQLAIIWGEMSPLEIPLEVRKGMVIARRQVRVVGRLGENLKLQRLQSFNLAQAVCGLALSRSNKIRDVDLLPRHTLRRRFFIVSMYQAELTVFPASKNSVM